MINYNPGYAISGTVPTVHKNGAVLNYVASSAEATHTFNFGTAIDPDDYECIIIDIDGEATGTGNLRMQINGQTTGLYESHGSSIAGGVETLINESAQTTARILDGLAATAPFGGRIIIFLPQGASEPNPTWICNMMRGANGIKVQVGGSLNASTTAISSITLLMSASTWKIGTKMTVTAIARALYQETPP